MLYKTMSDGKLKRESLLAEGIIILVDDDPLIRATWELKAKAENIDLRVFASRIEIEEVLDQYSRKTPIFVDYNLKEEASGLELLDELHAQSFERLFITTGYEKDDIETRAYLEEVIGKEPPW
jgi:DNA-binding NtrC family response regulator